LSAAILAVAGCQPESETESAPPPAPPSPSATVESAAVAPAKRVYVPTKRGCEAVTVFAGGEPAGSVCREDLAAEGLTAIDLSDSWTPRVFAPPPGAKNVPEYREKYLELANSPSAELGLNGIAPSFSIPASRLADEKRKSCDAAVDSNAIADKAVDAAGSDDKARKAALKAAQAKPVVSAIQEQLVCAGLLKKTQVSGQMSQGTAAALEAFRRRHMIIGAGLDEDTLHALALGGEELAFQAVLRNLRERVADASGLLEDGSASETKSPVVGRLIDLTRFAPIHEEAIAGGAPDLVGAATDVAARELGWTSPDAARADLAKRGKDLKTARVAVALPKPPAYHSAAMDLRVEVDRGDVFDGSPSEAAIERRKRGEERHPTFVVYAKDGERDVALMRWATTIGGFKKERSDDGEIVVKYKKSDVGDRVWRQIIAAPAWLPPESTPETDLTHEDKEGNVSLKRDLIQPGYRNAYGLVMLIHDEVVQRGSKTTYVDHGIRTHGSVDYRSIKRGSSHGCHRLYNQLALRLSGFLLQHRAFETRGKMHTDFKRVLEVNEQTIEMDVPSRGYLYELDPPVPVKVLEGSEVKAPVSAVKPTAAQARNG
jgi:hypothetical protein